MTVVGGEKELHSAREAGGQGWLPGSSYSFKESSRDLAAR